MSGDDLDPAANLMLAKVAVAAAARVDRTCRWKLGAAPICGQPATGTVHVRLPAEVATGVVIAPDQRDQDLDLCDEHRAFVRLLDAPDVFSLARSVTAGDLPIEPGHRSHSAYVAGCLGCAFDFTPPW